MGRSSRLPPRSSRRLHEGADALVILDAGGGLEAAARVDAPRIHRCDRRADVFRAKAAGQEHPALGAGRLLPVRLVLPEPRQVLHLRDDVVSTEEYAVAGPVAVL